MTGFTLTGSAVNPQNLIKANERSLAIGKNTNDKSAIKGLTFGDTHAWEQKSPLSHAFYRMMNKYYKGPKNKPFPIRTRAPTLSRYIWRKGNLKEGINKPVTALGYQVDSKIGNQNKQILCDSGRTSIEIKNIEGDKKTTVEFDWEFHQKVELNFPVRTKGENGPKTQTLQGFAYTSKQVQEQKKGEPPKIPGPPNPDPVQVPDFNQNDRPIVVFFGGHGAPVETFSKEGCLCQGMKYVDKKQVNFLALNYRGYGGSSDGVPSNQSMVEDGLAIVNHLLETGIDTKRIVLHGYSMGGNIAANVAEAAETKGYTLGGLILDRPMETLYTGASAISTQTKSRSSAKNNAVQNIIRFLCESYSTTKTLESLLRKRDLYENKQENQDSTKKAWTPVVGVYDTDPIGNTSKRMFRTRKIECTSMEHNHNAELLETLNALDTLHGKSSKEEPNSAINRLYENLAVKPPDDV